MEDKIQPFSGSSAARMLAESIARYTATNAGGLRALAAKLNIKQATVLSAMATGRMAIPLDRAQELAIELDMDPAIFGLAVLEQRAPTIYRAFDEAFDIARLGQASPLVRRLLHEALSAKSLNDDHVTVVSEALHSTHPTERWLHPLETGFMRVVRERFPDGVPFSEIEPLAEAIAKHFASESSN